MRKTPILLDADTGVDDAVALIYALKSPQIDLVGVTAVFGNTSAAQAARNSLDIIKLCGFEGKVPVAVGTGETVCGAKGEESPHVHGANGIGNAVLPASEQTFEEEDAVDFIIGKAREYAGELVIVATGRLTNLANALAKGLNRLPQFPHEPRLLRFSQNPNVFRKYISIVPGKHKKSKGFPCNFNNYLWFFDSESG